MFSWNKILFVICFNTSSNKFLENELRSLREKRKIVLLEESDFHKNALSLNSSEFRGAKKYKKFFSSLFYTNKLFYIVFFVKILFYILFFFLWKIQKDMKILIKETNETISKQKQELLNEIKENPELHIFINYDEMLEIFDNLFAVEQEPSRAFKILTTHYNDKNIFLKYCYLDSYEPALDIFQFSLAKQVVETALRTNLLILNRIVNFFVLNPTFFKDFLKNFLCVPLFEFQFSNQDMHKTIFDHLEESLEIYFGFDNILSFSLDNIDDLYKEQKEKDKPKEYFFFIKKVLEEVKKHQSYKGLKNKILEDLSAKKEKIEAFFFFLKGQIQQIKNYETFKERSKQFFSFLRKKLFSHKDEQNKTEEEAEEEALKKELEKNAKKKTTEEINKEEVQKLLDQLQEEIQPGAEFKQKVWRIKNSFAPVLHLVTKLSKILQDNDENNQPEKEKSLIPLTEKQKEFEQRYNKVFHHSLDFVNQREHIHIWFFIIFSVLYVFEIYIKQSHVWRMIKGLVLLNSQTLIYASNIKACIINFLLFGAENFLFLVFSTKEINLLNIHIFKLIEPDFCTQDFLYIRNKFFQIYVFLMMINVITIFMYYAYRQKTKRVLSRAIKIINQEEMAEEICF